MKGIFQPFDWITGVLVLGVLLFGIFLGWGLSAWYRRRQTYRSAAEMRRIGTGGEISAARYLEKHGFLLLEDQPVRTLSLEVDGECLSYTVRADFLVQQADRLYLVEAKNGAWASNPTEPRVRRQVLEYALAFPEAGILFWNATSSTLHELVFPWIGEARKEAVSGKTSRSRGRFFCAGVLILATMVAGGWFLLQR